MCVSEIPIDQLAKNKGRSLGPLKRDMLRISGDGIFYTLQGEGPSIGTPVLFLRLHECNLACGGPADNPNGGWRCDAWYTWDKSTPEYWAEPREVDLATIIGEMLAWQGEYNCRRWVLTGGEPLMQRFMLESVIREMVKHGAFFEIETNGTVMPTSGMSDLATFRTFKDPSIQFNVSPKLSNSGNPRHQTWKPEVLNVLADLNSYFKFVVSSEDDVHEIKEYAGFLPQNRIILMPEGVTEDELHKHMQVCDTLCKQFGWRLTPRLQVHLYGDARAT